MFKRKYYEQAVYCFKKSNEVELLKKATAYMVADDAANKLSQIEELSYSEETTHKQ